MSSSGGFAGPLSYYRNLQDNWLWWGGEAIERAPEVIPNWLGSRVLEGSGHWIQQERAAETNAIIMQFLRALH